MPHIETALISAGLNDKEAKVYLAGLELGHATATAIAKKSGINRATTYLVAENLILRGLMSSLHHDTKRVFVAEPPERLLARLKKEEETVENKMEALTFALPALEALVKSDAARPAVRYYEGLAGLETMREILYQHRREEVLNAIDMDALVSAIPHDNLRAHFKNAKRYDLFGRMLYTSSDTLNDRLVSETVNEKGWERRRLSANRFPFDGEVVIFGDRVAFLSYSNKVVGVLIEYPSFAKTIRSIFELAWLAAAPKVK